MHKTNYAQLVVCYFYIVFGLNDDLRKVREKDRTFSELGYENSNTGFDHGNKNFHWKIKAAKPSNQAQIDEKIQLQNAFNVIDEPARILLGVEREMSNHDATRVDQNDVDMLVHVLRAKLGATNAAVFGPRAPKSNPFGGNARPWNNIKISTVARGEYIRKQLNTPPI